MESRGSFTYLDKWICAIGPFVILRVASRIVCPYFTLRPGLPKCVESVEKNICYIINTTYYSQYFCNFILTKVYY